MSLNISQAILHRESIRTLVKHKFITAVSTFNNKRSNCHLPAAKRLKRDLCKRYNPRSNLTRMVFASIDPLVYLTWTALRINSLLASRQTSRCKKHAFVRFLPTLQLRKIFKLMMNSIKKLIQMKERP